MALHRLPSWAVATNYPAGANPWNGTPTKVAPVYSYWQPGPSFAPTAQEFNYIVNQLTLIGQEGISTALNNFTPTINSTSLLASSSWNAFTYDDAHRMWVGQAGDGGTNGQLLTLNDGQGDWTSRSTSCKTAASLASNASVIVQHDKSNGTSFFVTTPTGTTSNNINSTFRNSSTTWWSTADSQFYSVQVNDGGAGTFSAGTLVSTPNGVTNTVHTVPSAWISGTNHVSMFLHAQSPAFALVAMCGLTAGTDTARLGKVTANVLTDVTPSFLSSRIVTGLAYDDSAGLWLVLAYDGTSSTLWASADAVTWNSVSTFTGQRAGQGLVATGGAWVTLLNSLSNFESLMRPYLSFDQGATWTATSAKGYSQSPFSILRGGGLSSGRLLYAAGALVQTSLAIG